MTNDLTVLFITPILVLAMAFILMQITKYK